MYDVPRYRIKAYVQNLRRSRQQIQRLTQRIHILRSRAEIRVTDGMTLPFRPVLCRVILNEMTAMGVYLYSSDAISPGQRVSLTIQEPRMFYSRGIVLSCQPVFRSGGVISETPLRYRIAVEFQFQTREEREAVTDYCEGFLRERLYEGACA